MMATPLRIGTRASALARTQTEWVADQLRRRGVPVEIDLIETSGDRLSDTPIARIGSDGVFVRELERALLDRRIDAAVHSMKDMPTAETPGLVIAAVPARAMPFDVFVGRQASTLADLPAGAIVGTSSIRRVAQLKAFRNDLVVRPIRGNVDTRLRKLDAGECDGLILAGAGLERLGLSARVTEVLEPPRFWPAVAQGALAVQVREGGRATLDPVAAISDEETHRAVRAERACLAALAGGCLAPIAGWARADAAGLLMLDACVFEERKQDIDCLHGSAVAQSASETPESLGRRVARSLIERGAPAMIDRCRDRAAAPGVELHDPTNRGGR